MTKKTTLNIVGLPHFLGHSFECKNKMCHRFIANKTGISASVSLKRILGHAYKTVRPKLGIKTVVVGVFPAGQTSFF